MGIMYITSQQTKSQIHRDLKVNLKSPFFFLNSHSGMGHYAHCRFFSTHNLKLLRLPKDLFHGFLKNVQGLSNLRLLHVQRREEPYCLASTCRHTPALNDLPASFWDARACFRLAEDHSVPSQSRRGSEVRFGGLGRLQVHRPPSMHACILLSTRRFSPQRAHC